MSDSMFQDYESWMTDRLGKFTASEIYKLLVKGKGGEYFGQAAQTYIKQKAAEILTLEQNNGGRVNGNALEWGNAHEHEALLRLQQIRKGSEFIYYGGASPKFFELTPFSGGSPDAVSDDSEVVEIKCPYNSAEHIEHLLLNDENDLKSYYPEAYWQMTFNMICTGLDKGLFVSYDPRYADEVLQIKIISFDINEEDAALIKERVAEAEKQLSVMVGMVRDLIEM